MVDYTSIVKFNRLPIISVLVWHMTEVAGGQNEANTNFELEYFVNHSLYFNRSSCRDETYRICTIKDGEHFGKVRLRPTPR